MSPKVEWKRSGLADPGRRDRRAQPCAIAEVDVQAGQRLEVARVLQATGVDHVEAQALGQRGGGLLGACAVAGDEHGHLSAVAEIGAFGQHLCEHGVEALDDLCARHGLGDLLGGRGAVAQREAHVVGRQRVGNVDDDRALQVAHGLQRAGGVGIAGGQHHGVGAGGSARGGHGLGARVRRGDLRGLGAFSGRHADLMAGTDELLDEGRAHVAGADDCDFHDLSLGWMQRVAAVRRTLEVTA